MLFLKHHSEILLAANHLQLSTMVKGHDFVATMARIVEIKALTTRIKVEHSITD